MTTVLIVDDLNSIREFLKINLSSEPDIQIVALASDGEQAIAKVEEHHPDVVLMDIEMPGAIDGIQATEKITQRFPDTKVLLLTSQDDKQQLNRALDAGSRGYILKNTNVRDIASIIRLSEKGFFQIGPILGDWVGTFHQQVQSNANGLAVGNDYQVTTMLKESPSIKQSDEAFDMNFVLSNLTTGLFQLQETIKSQENTIENLTHQYSQVQQDIETKLTNNRRRIRQPLKSAGYDFKAAPIRRSQKRQHLLFIGSFLLGVLTVLVLMLLVVILGAWN
ncbi:MAG: response regulator transcription factor [Cyanobacteria bacterium P01_G01_bin.39]